MSDDEIDLDYEYDDGWAAQCMEEANEEIAEVRLKLSAMMAANLDLAAERDELRAAALVAEREWRTGGSVANAMRDLRKALQEPG